MMSASPGHSYEHDILGNRTYRNPSSYTAWRYVWDEAGRMVKAAGPSSGATCTYRADGMRVRKVDGLTLAWIDSEESASGFYDEIQSVNNDTWWYRYDGQMCFEEDLTKITGAPGNPVATITGTSYALGARGIDMLRPFEVENTSGYPRTYGAAQFPLYDGHGNMTATLSRSSSSPYYAVGSERTYDVWGGVRSGASTGDPNTRYCANLGHKQDDESGLIYMRARYYEPGTGRFVSQDSARDGFNWYVCCHNSPTNGVDWSGNETNWPSVLPRLAFVLNGIFRSAMFLPLLLSMVATGFLTLACCGLPGLVIGLGLVGVGAYESVEALRDIHTREGFWMKFETRKGDVFPRRRSGGSLSEVIGFLGAWYSLLSLMFEFIGPMVIGDPQHG